MLSVDSSITSFTDMLFERYKDDDTPPNVTRNMPLYPGYFWIVDAADDEYKIEDVKVGKNDRIYINGEGMIVLSAVTSARVDVEDVYDSDTVHEWQLNECSVSLTNALYEASCMLSSDDKYLSS